MTNTTQPAPVDFSNNTGTQARVDAFVRTIAPEILHLAHHPAAADLLALLAPLRSTELGQQWRRVLLPAQRLLVTLRRDRANLEVAIRADNIEHPLASWGSDIAFIAAMYPGVAEEMRLTAHTLGDAGDAGSAIVELIRLGMVISTLSHIRNQGALCTGLADIDARLTGLTTRPTAAPTETAAPLTTLVSTYLASRKSA
ncbi:hypothetical protein [Microbacterium testaceum]|uniref:hypothetical protein n=1 Tax=Microbacterium testaceum TaxID=2033 RepID=UPI002AC71FB0|nr:hypothetical protein [Microbacterium testaceum]MDZ5146319.1 hypothetical protein [Microbacterium testaceum]